jgi:hypothetical protein
MWRWAVVFAIFVALHMGWTQAAWSQDVGTPACRDAQLAVQSETGDQTDPPFTNHGQYVSAAAHAANLPLDSGAITEACHECIVSQFAQSIPVADQQACGPDVPTTLCAMSGGQGWENEVYSGGEGDIFTSEETPSAADCCQLCLNTVDTVDGPCLQWVFISSAITCVLNFNPANQCMGDLRPVNEVIPVADAGGTIRCQQ